MTEADIKLCVNALWDYQDARRADALYNSDFDRAEADLERSFRDFLTQCPTP